MNRQDKAFHAELLADYSKSHLGFTHVYNDTWDVECFHCRKIEVCKTRVEAKSFLFDHLECSTCTPAVEAPVVEAPAVEAPVIADSEIPAEIPAHLKVEMLKTGSWSFWCPVCQEGATARAFVIGGLVEHHAHCKPAKPKRKASGKPRKVRTRKSKQAISSSENQEPVAVTSEPVKAEAPAPVLMLPAPTPRLLLVQLPPPVRPDMIRKPMPPAPPANFEWILPPAPKTPVRAGLFSRVWSALKKIA